MKLNNKTTHNQLIGSEWWRNDLEGGPHVVAFLEKGSLYLIADIEEGKVSFSGSFTELLAELKQNYHE